MFSFTTNIFSTKTTHTIPMTLYAENSLPEINVRFWKVECNEIYFLCHIYICTEISTGNLLLSQWIITEYPNLVAEYIHCDDATPFLPIKLLFSASYCTVI